MRTEEGSDNESAAFWPSKRKCSSSVPVEQLDLKTGKVISRYGSISTAAKAVDVHKTGISKCCRGLYRCSAGFGWRYASIGIPEEASKMWCSNKRVTTMITYYFFHYLMISVLNISGNS